jgi:hypothetical protein
MDANGVVLISCDPIPDVVFGNTTNGWVRGDNGWGSSTVNPSGGIVVTQFQQNPAQNTAEAAADMFLNWVYATQAGRGGGFLNSHWNPARTDANGIACNTIETGCIDPSNPGDVRYNWIEVQLATIFANPGW